MNIGNGATEIETSEAGGEVIDPKAIAEAISNEAKAEDNLGLEIETEVTPKEDDLTIESNDNPDDNDTPAEEAKPENKAVEEKPTEETPATEEEDEGTFRVLGEHFYNEGILDGYSDEMENTPEAFQEMIESTVQKGIDDYKSSLNNPISKQFLDYIEDGGDPGQFIQLVSGPDYTQVTPEFLEENEATQKQILKAYYMNQGESQEDAEETIQAFEDAGTLGKKSKVALDKLQKSQVEHRAGEVKRQQQAAAEQKAKVEEYITALKDDISGREEIAGFKLSKKDRAGLFDYITKVDPKTNQTKLLTDSQDPEKQLLMAFFYKNNFKFDKLAKQVKSDTTKTLMEKLGRTTDSATKQKSRKRTPAPKTEIGSFNSSVLKNSLK